MLTMRFSGIQTISVASCARVEGLMSLDVGPSPWAKPNGLSAHSALKWTEFGVSPIFIHFQTHPNHTVGHVYIYINNIYTLYIYVSLHPLLKCGLYTEFLFHKSARKLPIVRVIPGQFSLGTTPGEDQTNSGPRRWAIPKYPGHLAHRSHRYAGFCGDSTCDQSFTMAIWVNQLH